MWILFLIYCLLGIIMLIIKRTQDIKSFVIIKMMGFLFLVLGIVGMVGMAVGNEKMCVCGSLFPISVVIMGETWIVRMKKQVCNLCVEAKCTNYASYSGGKGQTTYAPIFTYTFDGGEYRSQSPLSYSKKKIAKKYITGQMYQIYINEEYPQDCIDTKKIPLTYYFLEWLGWGMLVFTFFLLFK